MKVFYRFSSMDDDFGWTNHLNVQQAMTAHIMKRQEDQIRELAKWLDSIGIKLTDCKPDIQWTKSYERWEIDSGVKLELPDDVALLFKLKFTQ